MRFHIVNHFLKITAYSSFIEKMGDPLLLANILGVRFEYIFLLPSYIKFIPQSSRNLFVKSVSSMLMPSTVLFPKVRIIQL